ncbi:MAG TPA: hypothetical protein VK914_11785 [bacterium]|jgi:hypothetical protein|nr:hypothetical protein [bacterium]
MRVVFALLLLISPGLLPADGPDPSLPAGDQRAIRELQAKEYGAPTLADDAPAGEGLLALAALGSSASQPGDQSLQADDYAALLALLQRYRDDLLKMGMDSSELQAQLSILQARTNELEARLDALQPRDGLKLYGRFYSLYDDLEVLGPGYIPQTSAVTSITPGSYGKSVPNQGVRTMIGQAHAQLQMEGTRGPVTGYAQMDLLMPWGDNVGQVGLRKVDVEMRLPIAVEAGDLDASLTPLTLWRSDSYQPFEPSLFSERYQRMEDDLLLKPNDWPITGVRLSTQALLFNSVTLRIQYLAGTVGNAAAASLINYSQEYVYLESPSAGGYGLLERYNTYLQGWQISAPMLENRLSLGYEGLVFFDVSSTGPTTAGQGFEAMNESVQSLSASYKSDHILFDAEAAVSSYQEPWQSTSPESAEGPLTGTALTADGTWKGDKGYVKVFGRFVSSGFHASGAQGRTVDYAYQFLGPFLTENSQIGASGTEGLEGTAGGGFGSADIALSNASRLNDQLIPPGVFTSANPTQPGGVWQNLLAYGPGEEIDPYGPATPNRAGGGLEATYSFFNGGLAPLASAESFEELDPVTASMGNIIDPSLGSFDVFSMTRYRGGLMLDLAPMMNFPLRVGGGVTMTDSQNGQQTNGITDSMTTQTTDFSVQWNAGHPMGVQAGYRQMTAQGQDETFVFGSSGETWETMGVGVWWRPTPMLSVDVTTTMGTTTIPGHPAAVKSSVSADNPESGNLQWAENLVRATLEF